MIAQDSGNRGNESDLGRVWPDWRPHTATPLAAFDYLTLAIRNYHDSGNTTTIRIPLAILAAHSRPARTLRSGGHHRRFRAQSPHRNVDPRDQHGDRPPPRGPRRPDLRIARPQGRDDDHRRHGHLRIRPNRPGPNRTERGLEIDPNETPVGTIGGHVRNLRPTAAPTGSVSLENDGLMRLATSRSSARPLPGSTARSRCLENQSHNR